MLPTIPSPFRAVIKVNKSFAVGPDLEDLQGKPVGRSKWHWRALSNSQGDRVVLEAVGLHKATRMMFMHTSQGML